MSRLTEAGEKISETLFNALVVNGLPEKYEHFVVQESFNPAANFTELRTRLLNYDHGRIQRNQAEEDSATAMHSGSISGTYNLAASRMLKIQKVTLHLLKELVMFQ